MTTTTTVTSVPVAPGWPQVSALSGERMGDGTPSLTEAAPPAPLGPCGKAPALASVRACCVHPRLALGHPLSRL